MKRRELLATLPVATLAGCSAILDNGSEQPTKSANRTAEPSVSDDAPAEKECQVMKSLLSASPVSPDENDRSYIVPVELSSQKKSVREVFDRAITGEEITACPTQSPMPESAQALTDAINRVDTALATQREEYDGNPPGWLENTVYLRDGSDFYSLTARLSDEMVSIGSEPDE